VLIIYSSKERERILSAGPETTEGWGRWKEDEAWEELRVGFSN
jgi:hypothetical protein